jgi:hypothetical protein
MYDFKSRYIYLVFGLRLLGFAFFMFYSILIFYFGPDFIAESTNDFKLILGVLAGLVFALYVPYRFAKLLITQRNDLILQNNLVFLMDAITGKEVCFDLSEIKGYSTSIYKINIRDFETIFLHLNTGKKIEFPQFLYWNFKDIRPAIEAYSIPYLGFDKPAIF